MKKVETESQRRGRRLRACSEARPAFVVVRTADGGSTLVAYERVAAVAEAVALLADASDGMLEAAKRHTSSAGQALLGAELSRRAAWRAEADAAAAELRAARAAARLRGIAAELDERARWRAEQGRGAEGGAK